MSGGILTEADARTLQFNDRAAFRRWAATQPRKHIERQDGRIIAMAPERLVHARLKLNACMALRQAIDAGGRPCEAFVDGPTVEIGQGTDYEPDVVVTCGERGRDSELAVGNPVVVVEVLSPSTGYRDAGVKLVGYFSLPSLQHYLLVASESRLIVHHSRLESGDLLTRLHHAGPIELIPPGLHLTVEAVYQGTELAA